MDKNRQQCDGKKKVYPPGPCQERSVPPGRQRTRRPNPGSSRRWLHDSPYIFGIRTGNNAQRKTGNIPSKLGLIFGSAAPGGSAYANPGVYRSSYRDCFVLRYEMQITSGKMVSLTSRKCNIGNILLLSDLAGSVLIQDTITALTRSLTPFQP